MLHTFVINFYFRCCLDEDDKEEAISEKFSAGQESTSRIVIKLSAMHSK